MGGAEMPKWSYACWGVSAMRMVMPIGVNDFAKVRRDFYFVDKTAFLAHVLVW